MFGYSCFISAAAGELGLVEVIAVPVGEGDRPKETCQACKSFSGAVSALQPFRRSGLPALGLQIAADRKR
jgi:hypothetical protein